MAVCRWKEEAGYEFIETVADVLNVDAAYLLKATLS